MISGRLNAPTPIGLIVNAGVVNSWVLISGRVNPSTEIPEGPRLDDDVGEGEGGDVDCADREADAVDLTSTHGNGPSINKGRRCISEAANLREYPGHIGLQGSDVVRNEHHQISYRNAVKAKGGKIDDTRICLRGYAGSAKAAYTYLGCTY